jgi:hypothetical protein
MPHIQFHNIESYSDKLKLRWYQHCLRHRFCTYIFESASEYKKIEIILASKLENQMMPVHKEKLVKNSRANVPFSENTIFCMMSSWDLGVTRWSRMRVTSGASNLRFRCLSKGFVMRIRVRVYWQRRVGIIWSKTSRKSLIYAQNKFTLMYMHNFSLKDSQATCREKKTTIFIFWSSNDSTKCVVFCPRGKVRYQISKNMRINQSRARLYSYSHRY